MLETSVTYKDKPWLKSYKLGPYKLPEKVEIPKVPLYKVLDDTSKAYPDKSGVFFQDWTMTYRDFEETVDKLATGLADLGVRKGDKVAIILPMSPQIVICSFAIWKVGGVVLLISPLARIDEIQYQLSETRTGVIVCLDEPQPRLASIDSIMAIKDNLKIGHIIVTSRKDFSVDENVDEIREIQETVSLRRLIAESIPEPPSVEIDPDEDMAMLMFTGGTTGVPKGVMLTHSSIMATVVTGLPWVLRPIQTGIWGKASILVVMPIYHAAGFWAVLQGMFMGLRIMLVPDPRDTGNIIKVIKEHRPMIIVSTPTQLMRLVQMRVGKLPSLVISTGAPLPLEIAQAWKKETGMPVAQAYGASEGGMLLNISGFSKLTGFMFSEKLGVGVPAPNVEAKIVDPETNKEVPIGEVGEICVTGPHLMKGYWPTAGSGLKDGWLHTGDLGKMDADGYFYVEDRIKDMINVSGLKVYSVKVEEVLFQHPAVAMAAVIGILDPERPGSERVKAFIKVKEEYEGKVTGEEIIAFCKEQLPPYAVPRFVEFREDLPISAVEKLVKRALREEEITKMKGG